MSFKRKKTDTEFYKLLNTNDNEQDVIKIRQAKAMKWLFKEKGENDGPYTDANDNGTNV